VSRAERLVQPVVDALVAEAAGGGLAVAAGALGSGEREQRLALDGEGAEELAGAADPVALGLGHQRRAGDPRRDVGEPVAGEVGEVSEQGRMHDPDRLFRLALDGLILALGGRLGDA
jgi:hypothetical protein